jgi:hypothetical protein
MKYVCFNKSEKWWTKIDEEPGLKSVEKIRITELINLILYQLCKTLEFQK